MKLCLAFASSEVYSMLINVFATAKLVSMAVLRNIRNSPDMTRKNRHANRPWYETRTTTVVMLTVRKIVLLGNEDATRRGSVDEERHR